jgi:hypothetical protein
LLPPIYKRYPNKFIITPYSPPVQKMRGKRGLRRLEKRPEPGFSRMSKIGLKFWRGRRKAFSCKPPGAMVSYLK